ncbi:1,6-anhydro-N-acetylmuramyl-L-alanine amidase AmpD [Pseudomonas aeruginosa]|uniref:1,6-anhydro-N-acetylmuramyl-L-alanine amidase AmpD n=3 Tax=Gammaproteobacteria TaxID=1236 RepID=UPI003760C56B
MHFDSVTGWVRGVRHCPSPNFNLRPQGDAVSLLVIHNISLPPGQFGTGKVQAFFQNRLDPNEHPYFEEIRHLTVSAHFLIERDGAITQFVSCHDRAWLAWLGLVEDLPSVSRRSWLGLLLAVVLPLLPLALLLTLLQPLAYGWLSLPLHLLVVVYSLGRGDVMADLGPFRDAWRREEAQAAFHVAERDLGILGGSESDLIGRVHGHLLWQGYQSFFAVIFWYALLGPVAALAYRLLALALEHARQPALREQAARVRHILDWLPVRALVLSFALVGNFLAVIRVLLHWLLAWDISAAALLGKAGRVASDVEAVELGAAGVASLDALWQLLVRAAVLWYAVFAFCALFL